MRRYLQLFTALTFATVASQAYAGAWTQAQGDTQIIMTGAYYSASDLYDNRGHTQSQPAYSKYELSPYVEYGLSDDITLGGNLSLQDATQSRSGGTPAQTNWGLGDSEFFVRKRLWQQNGFVASIQPLIKLPSPESSTLDQPMLGGSHPDLALGLSGGYGFSAYGLNHFVDVDTQYRYRFGPSHNQMKIAAIAGVHVSDKWLLMPQLFLTERTSTPATVSYTQSSGDDYNVTRLQLSAVYSLNASTSFQFGGFDDVNGKNTGHGKGVLLAIWKRI